MDLNELMRYCLSEEEYDAAADAIAVKLLREPTFVESYANTIVHGGEYARVSLDMEPNNGRAAIWGLRRDTEQWESIANVPGQFIGELTPLWAALVKA